MEAVEEIVAPEGGDNGGGSGDVKGSNGGSGKEPPSDASRRWWRCIAGRVAHQPRCSKLAHRIRSRASKLPTPEPRAFAGSVACSVCRGGVATQRIVYKRLVTIRLEIWKAVARGGSRFLQLPAPITDQRAAESGTVKDVTEVMKAGLFCQFAGIGEDAQAKMVKDSTPAPRSSSAYAQVPRASVTMKNPTSAEAPAKKRVAVTPAAAPEKLPAEESVRVLSPQPGSRSSWCRQPPMAVEKQLMATRRNPVARSVRSALRSHRRLASRRYLLRRGLAT